MSYHFIGFNTNYMFGFGGCCNRFMPFVPYSFNYFYNPFAVFNTAMQIMNNGFESVFKTPQPMFTQTFTPIIMPSWNNNSNLGTTTIQIFKIITVFMTGLGFILRNHIRLQIQEFMQYLRLQKLQDLTI